MTNKRFLTNGKILVVALLGFFMIAIVGMLGIHITGQAYANDLHHGGYEHGDRVVVNHQYSTYDIHQILNNGGTIYQYLRIHYDYGTVTYRVPVTEHTTSRP